MAVNTEELMELIAEGKRFTWDNFAEKDRRHGGADILSVGWLVWLSKVNELLAAMDPSVITSMIAEDSGATLVDYADDKFERSKKLILNGLEAALVRANGASVPASDRVVSLGHNSPEQEAALEKIDEVIAALQGANDFPGDEEAKEQIIAELSAGRRILEASKVRVAALSTMLAPPLQWLMEKAAGSMIGKAASAAWDYLAGLHFF